MSTTDRCQFLHPEVDGRGRWYGACEAGLASGQGYGVIADAAGAAVEYVGEADRGYATGVGAMILRRGAGDGARYLEGVFNAGLADGAMRVEAPGQGVRWRRFVSGEDRGRADAAAPANFGFSPQPGTVSVLPP